MSISAKRTAAIASQREPAVACPRCETRLMPCDVLAHLERCAGPREPHPLAAWLSMEQALALGVTHETVERWRARGLVRVRGEGDELRLLARDLVQAVAMARVLGE